MSHTLEVVGVYALAAIPAAGISSFLLTREHRRHPFGDARQRALWWWCGLLFLDAAVAALLLTGALKLDPSTQLDGIKGPLRAFVLGVLGPLAFRSPIREKDIKHRTEGVGITYLYDLIRIAMDRRLEDRIIHLRRSDRERVYTHCQKLAWDSVSFRGRIEEHLDELRSRDKGEMEKLYASVRAAMTSDDETLRIRTLITISISEGFRALLADCQKQSPTTANRQRGEKAARADAALLTAQSQKLAQDAEAVTAAITAPPG
ncbi:MAG: hypothetical protein ACLPUT_01860 [Solirubrobacteraceae bacterium]